MAKLTNKGRPRKNPEDETIPDYSGESRLPVGWIAPEGCTRFDTRVFADCWSFRERVRTVDWFEKNLIVDGRTSDYAGAWNRYNFYYQVGVLDAFDDVDVRQISLQWGAQVGKSFLIQNIPAKVATTDPSPMMFGAPDETTAKEISSKRIMPAFEKIPVLADKLLPEARRNVMLIDLGDCLMFMGWSGSPSTLGQRSCRYVFCTELSKWSQKKSDEADPTELIKERVKAFWDSKILVEGTPTEEGRCKIEQQGRLANQRLRFFVPCPHCGKYQILWFSQVKWEKLKEKNDADLAYSTAYFECVACKGKINDGQKIQAVKKGIWAEEGAEIPEGYDKTIYYTDGRNKTHIHFDLSSIYSPVITFGAVAKAFINANNGVGSKRLQNFVNSWLAEVYSPIIKDYDWKKLNILRADTPMGTVPPWVVFLTAGVDIGRHCAHYVIRGWGAGGRSRLIDCGIINYSSVDNIAFEAIEAHVLQTVWGDKPVAVCGIDSGYQSYNVYTWAIRMNQKYGERVRCIKGQPKGIPYYCTQIERSGADGKIIEGGIGLWNINDGVWKDYVTSKYSIPAGSPESFEIPSDVSETYIRSLTAEALIEKTDSRGNATYVWKVIDKVVGNHYFDAEKISAAIADMCDWRSLSGTEVVSQPIVRQIIQEQTGEDFIIDGSDYWN